MIPKDGENERLAVWRAVVADCRTKGYEIRPDLHTVVQEELARRVQGGVSRDEVDTVTDLVRGSQARAAWRVLRRQTKNLILGVRTLLDADGTEVPEWELTPDWVPTAPENAAGFSVDFDLQFQAGSDGARAMERLIADTINQLDDDGTRSRPCTCWMREHDRNSVEIRIGSDSIGWVPGAKVREALEAIRVWGQKGSLTISGAAPIVDRGDGHPDQCGGLDGAQPLSIGERPLVTEVCPI